MAEGPAEGEWEEDAGMGAAAAERRREMALEREKAKEAGDAGTEPQAPVQKVRRLSPINLILIISNPFIKKKKIILSAVSHRH